jgi:hypothetical protein
MLALSAVLCQFDRVYLVIDALDESLGRENILDLLVKIVGNKEFEKLYVIAVSRCEADIETALQHVSTAISLSNPWVDEDIRIYLQSRLRSDSRFSRWPRALIAEIQDALQKDAKGM